MKRQLSWMMRAGIMVTVAATTIVQVVPVWAGNKLPKPVKIDWNAQLPKGETQCLTPAQWKQVAANQAKEAAKQAANRPAVRLLTAREMRSHRGAGDLRNKYFSGSQPWTRSLRDVNLCNGNLFKSFTDIQVQGGHGAGLALQRTYNSEDDRVGPFGTGWTHAYDIRNTEENPTTTNPDASLNYSDRSDFFGARRPYHRDADGLYTPPAYLYDEHDSTYMQSLANGPLSPADDDDIGPDGTVKHYLSDDYSNPNLYPISSSSRWCDYIEDRYAQPMLYGIGTPPTGHATVLSYKDYTFQTSQTFHCLYTVTDPSGRQLTFWWANVGTQTSPLARVVQIDGPQYSCTYLYDGNGNLNQVTLDASTPSQYPAPPPLQPATVAGSGPHLARRTQYAYTSVMGTDSNGNPDTETGLLYKITDPLQEVTQYAYQQSAFTGCVWVTQVAEPAGVIPGTQTQRTHLWNISSGAQVNTTLNGLAVSDQQQVGTGQPTGGGIVFTIFPDQYLRFSSLILGYALQSWYTRAVQYDSSNNVTQNTEIAFQPLTRAALDNGDGYTYNTQGQPLKHWKVLTGGSSDQNLADVTTYYNLSGFFQKKTVTDMNQRTTSFTVGSNTAGGTMHNGQTDPDTNVGDRGSVLAVQDAGYTDPNSPSYNKQYVYTYNNYGQKASETNLNGVVTQYTYGGPTDYGYNPNNPNAAMGNLTQVVQDPGGLSRTTTLMYDVAGHVTASQDPLALTSSFSFNNLGQPVSASFPASGLAPANSINYEYADNGRAVSVSDGSTSATFLYELGSDRVSSVTQTVITPAPSNITSVYTVGYTYLLNGERNTMTLPAYNQAVNPNKTAYWSYAYAPGNQGQGAGNTMLPKDDPNAVCMALAGITDDQGRQIQFWLETDGRPDRVWTNETYTTGNNPTLVSYNETDYTYDQPDSNGNTHGWLTQLTTNFDVVGGASTLLSQNAYTYDNIGQRLTNQVSGTTGTRTETYTYEDLNRLATVNYGDGETQSYTFDAMGNRATKSDSSTGNESYIYNHANMLTSRTVGSNTTNYSNDLDGNTLSGTGGRTSAWDSENRMVSCAYTSNGTNNQCSYVYGADGIRLQSTVNGTTTNFVTDNSMMIQELSQPTVNDGTGTPTATYLQGAQGPVYRRNDTAGTVAWYVYDGLGSVAAEVSPTGTVNASRKYDVYGTARATNGTPSSKQAFVGQLGHTSEPETGLIYMRARYVDPAVGRFVSEDPGKQGCNWFAYAADAPTVSVDAKGTAALWINTVIQGPEWLVEGAQEAFEEGGLDALADFLAENWLVGSINFAVGTSPAIGGLGGVQINLLVEKLLLDGVSEVSTELGGYSFYAVDSDLIGRLIGGAIDGDLIDAAM